MEEKQNKHPSGEEILATLIELLEEQEKIKITYQIVKRADEKVDI